MQAPRRALSQIYAAQNLTQYSYNFNVLPAGVPYTKGVSHFVEVAFVFANTLGVGYENVVAVNPFKGAPEANFRVAKMMSRMWISFFYDMDPNNSGGK
jgi:triacylglycerol lipase